jgi:hypothetical protein
MSKAPAPLDLDWVPDKWWPLVTGRDQRRQPVREIGRRYFDLCALTQLAHALQSGDIVIVGSDKFSDYRDQFVSPEEYGEAVGEYCTQVGLPTDKTAVPDGLRSLLEQAARRADEGFPENEHLRIDGGEPVLSRLERRPEPEQLRLIEQSVAEELQPVSILDALADTAGSATTTSPINTSRCFHTSFHAACGRRFTFSTGCYRTRARSNLIRSTPTPRGNQPQSSGWRTCWGSS